MEKEGGGSLRPPLDPDECFPATTLYINDDIVVFSFFSVSIPTIRVLIAFRDILRLLCKRRRKLGNYQ